MDDLTTIDDSTPPNDLRQTVRAMRDNICTIVDLAGGGRTPAGLAAEIRRTVDVVLRQKLGDTLSRDTMPRADRALFDTLMRLESEPGAAISTTRAALAVESNLRPTTVDCSLYRMQRDGLLRKTTQAGKGTTIEILRRPAP
jgi:hypothetical protein